jgi:ABC-type transporter MlaC component
MKRSLIVFLFVTLFAVLSSIAQTPDPKDDQEKLLTLVKEVQAQQAQIAANQTKIDAKLADLAETLRVARIFSSRSR